MTPSRAEASHSIDARWGRWIGTLLLIHFLVVCVIKLAQGRGEEIAWGSHVALGLSGLGMTLRRPVWVATALTLILVPHAIWLADFFGWLALGRSPMGITAYLDHATAWDWLATAHHFYLAALLLVIVLGHHEWPRRTGWWVSVLFFWMMIITRATTQSDHNVNYCYQVLPGADHPALNAINQLPDAVYLLSLSAATIVGIYLPTALALGVWHRRLHGRRSPHGATATDPTAQPVADA